MSHDLIIIGGGPAAYTAALYASRAQFKPIVFEGKSFGGQLMTTTLVENFPGFPQGVQGPELVANMREQAKKFGTEFMSEEVIAVDFKTQPFRISTSEEITSPRPLLVKERENIYEARAVIIATGAKARRLGIPSEEKLWGKGVSTCATCDGFFFRNKEVAVLGGGDSALEEALFLTQMAKKVTIIHRRDCLRASKFMQERAKANPKIAFLWETVVEEIVGEQKVTGLKLKNLKTNELTNFSCDGISLALGHEPSTALLRVSWN